MRNLWHYKREKSIGTVHSEVDHVKAIALGMASQSMLGARTICRYTDMHPSSPRPREDVIAAPTDICLPVPLFGPHLYQEHFANGPCFTYSSANADRLSLNGRSHDIG